MGGDVQPSSVSRPLSTSALSTVTRSSGFVGESQEQSIKNKKKKDEIRGCKPREMPLKQPGSNQQSLEVVVSVLSPCSQVLYEDCRMVAVSAPYVAGFLAFREVPFLVEALQRLEQQKPELKPQVLLVDGNGLLHPRGFGVACHLGVLTGLPCIGVAKNLLQVDGLVKDELHKEQIRSLRRGGDSFPLTGSSGGVLGMALRSYDKSSKPLYVSVGHRVCLETALRLVKSCCRYRVPEPIRQADIRSREYIRQQLCSPLEVTSSGPERKKEAELDD
ncbi:endonuclease V isoform X2 [Melanerpes formicivorus]|uniref:endonuclease V isoform X2 n=1 Tax=Melanerpes formicivorus TaxID=211600 RepID=UPI00358E55A6